MGDGHPRKIAELKAHGGVLCPMSGWGRAFHVLECFRRFTTGSQSLMVYLSGFAQDAFGFLF